MLNFPNIQRGLILSLDCVIFIFSYYLSFALRFDHLFPYQLPNVSFDLASLTLHIICSIASFFILGIYNNLWKYASFYEIKQIGKGTFLAALLTLSSTWFYNSLEGFPASLLIIEYVLVFLFISLRSFSWRMIRELKIASSKKQLRTLVIGLSEASYSFIQQLKATNLPYKPMAVLDVKIKCNKSYLNGLPVYNDLNALQSIIKDYRIEQVIITEKLDSSKNRFIYHYCENLGVNCKILHSFTEASNDSQFEPRNFRLEDLLGRVEVRLESVEIENMIQGKIVLITGAGGSIGSELCRQILIYKPSTIVLLDISENALYEIDREVRISAKYSKIEILPIIGSIGDEFILKRIFHDRKIHIVFHCAAYKHVPLMELNIEQALKNNLLGTVRLAEAARHSGVERFVMLSTDKAVNPVSIMGVTKRIAELYIQKLSIMNGLCFLAVRFGNVLGSQGSVVPLFAKQIAAGGPVTVTHPDVTRYFMSISEAVGLVLQATVLGKGGEIFILDMGEPIHIKELAEDMIRIFGFVPHKDILIEYIGLRAGEKLYEELLNVYEIKQKTSHPQIHVALNENLNFNDSILSTKISNFIENMFYLDKEQLNQNIQSIIPEYTPTPTMDKINVIRTAPLALSSHQMHE